MATRMVTNLQVLLPIMLLYPLVMWSCKITWQTKIISTTAMPMATKLCRGVTYHKGGPPIKSHGPWITCFCKIIWQTKTIISPLSQCYGYKAWDVVDLTWVSSSHDHVIRFSWEITQHAKITIHLLPQWQTTKHVRYAMRSFHQQSCTTLWIRGHMRSHDKLRTSPLPPCLWPPDLVGLVKKMWSFPP